MSYRRRNVEMLAQQASSPYPEFLSFNMIGFFNTKAQKVFSELYCSIDVPLLTAFLKQSSDPSFHFRKTWNQYCTSACKSRENMTTIQDGTTKAQTVSAIIHLHAHYFKNHSSLCTSDSHHDHMTGWCTWGPAQVRHRVYVLYMQSIFPTLPSAP